MLYYPILRIKKGEADALTNLKSNTRAAIRPVLIIPPMETVILSTAEKDKGVSLVAKQQRKDENYAPGFAKNLKIALNGTTPLSYYLDAKPANLSSTLLQKMLDGIKSVSIKPRPVLYLQGSATYWQLYNKVFGHPEGVMLRLKSSEIASPATLQTVKQLYNDFNLVSTDLVIMLDAGDVSGVDVGMYASSIVNMCAQLHRILPHVECIVAGGGYPSSLTRVAPWTQHRFERKCWKLWQNVRQWQEISFADYGPMSAVTLAEAAQRGAPKVRYTLDSTFMLYQGVVKTVAKMPKGSVAQPRTLKPPPSSTEQYLIISSEVCGLNDYPGAHFSWGDNHMFQSSDPLFLKRGNPTTWVTVNVSHHIEHVVATLANRP
jgi:hypothetical protein